VAPPELPVSFSRMGKGSAHPAPPICELRVELQGNGETCAWRVIRLSSGVLLPRLNRVLLTALGWFKASDWWFEAAQVRYGKPNESNDVQEAATVRLRHILPDTGTEASYSCVAVGAWWQHRLTIDRLLTPNPEMRDPVCLSGGGTVPTGHARAQGFDVRVTNAELAQLRR
jgi:hypothetical protein